MATTVTPDTEIFLSFEHQRAVVSPWGASLRRYFLLDAAGREVDLVWGYAGGHEKKGGQGDVLIPFAGRIADGRYSFEGRTFQLERNDKEGPNAIHGFVRALPWTIHDRSPHHCAFEIGIEAAEYEPRGYPFSLAIRLVYTLDQRGLTGSFLVRNAGDGRAPVCVGFHPYFTVGTATIDEADALIPAAGYLEFNERLVPTGRIASVAGTEWDYRQFQRIGSRRFNHCYVQLARDAGGICTASLRHPSNGRVIDVDMDEAFTAIVVYTGDAIVEAPRRALAIEPMTGASDAFNHPEWGLKALKPDERFTGRYTIRSRDDAAR